MTHLLVSAGRPDKAVHHPVKFQGKEKQSPGLPPVIAEQQEVLANGGAALKAALLPRFGAAKAATETAILKTAEELGIPELAVILENAKAMAKENKHAEVTPLHVLAAQVEMLHQETEGLSDSQVRDLFDGEEKNPHSLWEAVLGMSLAFNTPGENIFHLQGFREKITKALAALPKEAAPTQPKLSRNLLDIFDFELSQLKNNALSNEALSRMAEEKLPPEVVMTKQKIEKKLDELEAQLEPFAEQISAADEKLSKVPGLKTPLSQVMMLMHFANCLMQGKPVPPEAVLLRGNKPIPLNSIPPEMALKGLEEMLGQAQKELQKAMLPHQTKIMEVFGKHPAEALQESLPEEALFPWISLDQAQDQYEGLTKSMEPLMKEIAQKAMEEETRAHFEELVTAPFQSTLRAKFLSDPVTATAQKLYTQFYDLLSAGGSVQTEYFLSYLNAAKDNGAGDAEIGILTNALATMKELSYSLRAKDEGDKSDSDAASKPFRLKLLKMASSFVKAYSSIDWNAVRNKTVDLSRAKQILDADDLIPTPIKKQIINFLKTGNRNGWHQQPLLLLVGGGGTDMVKQAVVKDLQTILDMPIYHPKGEVESTITLGSGGKVMKGDPKLSPPAQAIVDNKTPQSIVYIDNLLRFTVGGGQKMFDDFASEYGRKSYEEQDLGLNLDLRPFVFVASLEDGYSGQYLSLFHGDRFNDKDISIIELGVDIDTFTKEKVAARTAKTLEMEYNVRFGPGVVQSICRDYAIYGRHDQVESKLREAAKSAAGSVVDSNGPVEIKLEDLETQWLGPKITRSTNNCLTAPTVGSVNGLAAGGAGIGFVLRIGTSKVAEWHYDPRKDKGGRYNVKATLGPVTKMTEDSAHKALEAYLTDLLNNTVTNYSSQYKLLHGLRHKAMTFQVVFPEDVDGPSAGAAMATTAISTLTGIPIRHDVAMTGTIQDKGTVGPIGGIFGKTKAAYEAGIKVILMPEMNHIELQQEHPRFFKRLTEEGIQLVSVKTMDDVLKHALTDYNALLKEPTQEQLQIDQYDPLGKLKEEEGGGADKLKALLEGVVSKSNTDAAQTMKAVLEQVFANLPQLLAAKSEKPPTDGSK